MSGHGLEEFFARTDEVAADAVGSRREEATARARVVELLACELGGERYAVDILAIAEITKVPAITPVPRVERAVLGITSLRGSIVPVLDLREVLGLECTPLGREARVIVLHAGEEPLGLVVDRITHVVRLTEADIEPAPAAIARQVADVISGVGRTSDTMVIVLDVQALLARLGGEP